MEQYEELMIEVIVFEGTDVIVTSGNGEEDEVELDKP